MLCLSPPTDPILAGKIQIERCRNFLSRVEPSDLLLKIKNATLNAAHFLTATQKVACLKCFEKLEVMNYRSKVSEIDDFPAKNPWSDRLTHFKGLFRTRTQHISNARLI